MNNEIAYITKDEAKRIKMNALKNQDAYLAEIDGARIRTEEDIILPWWEGEVVGHMVDGEPRGFMLYIERSKARR